MDLDIKVIEYLNDLSSSSPTPGGGNVAAFCGVLASCLGIMVCNLTIGKKKYADVEQDLKLIKSQLEVHKKNLQELAEEDNEAFNKVMKAFKLPKETEEDKKIRIAKIEESTVNAGITPFKVINECNEMLNLIEIIVQKGNVNSLSDAGVSVSLIRTASEGAYLNVLINCSGYKQNDQALQLIEKSNTILNDVIFKTENLLNNTIDRLS